MGNRGSLLTADKAQTIAKKLSQPDDIKSGKHFRASVRDEAGHMITQFGWSHDRKKGNGHIPRELMISLRFAIDMANCHHDYRTYMCELRKNAKIPELK